MRRRPDLLVLLRTPLLLTLVALLVASQVQAAARPSSPYCCSANERLGFDVDGSINPYDVGRLHAGWYVSYPRPIGEAPHSAGLDYVQVMSVCDNAYRHCGHPYSPHGAQLASFLVARQRHLFPLMLRN